MREAARRRPLSVLLGSVGPILIGVGVLAAAVAPAMANVFAGGRPIVHAYVLIGFLLMPISMLSWLLSDFATGLGRWGLLIAMRLMTPLLTTVALVALYVAGALTVATAAGVTLTAGLVSIVPVLPLLREAGRPRFERRIAAECVPFGAKAWLGGLGSLVNLRLDQMLMTRLVVPRELGLYVVAVTMSSFFINPVLNALTTGMVPRFSAGDFSELGKVLRTTLLGVGCVGAVIALITPVALPLLFGHAFARAVPMVLVLVIGTIPLAGNNVLSTALTTGGRPGFSAASELIGIIVTVPALIVVLPRYGGMGAAVVSGAAYTVSFLVLLIGSKRQVAIAWRELLVPQRTDVVGLVGRVWEVSVVRGMRERAGRTLRRRRTSSSSQREM